MRILLFSFLALTFAGCGCGSDAGFAPVEEEIPEAPPEGEVPESPAEIPALEVEARMTGSFTERVRRVEDVIAILTFTVHADHPLVLQQLTLHFAGDAVFGTPLWVRLVNGGGTTFGSSVVTTADKSGAVFLPNFIIPPRASVDVQVVIDSTFLNNALGHADALTCALLFPEDVLWSDGAATRSLVSSQVPLVVSELTYE